MLRSAPKVLRRASKYSSFRYEGWECISGKLNFANKHFQANIYRLYSLVRIKKKKKKNASTGIKNFDINTIVLITTRDNLFQVNRSSFRVNQFYSASITSIQLVSGRHEGHLRHGPSNLSSKLFVFLNCNKYQSYLCVILAGGKDCEGRTTTTILPDHESRFFLLLLRWGLIIYTVA